MKRAILLATAALLAILIVAVQVPWLPLYLLFWLGCPQGNALSASCGDYTLGFILVRVLVVSGVVLAVAIVASLWKASKKGRA